MFITAAHGRYREELKARNAIDFDDLIRLTVRLFRQRPEVLARWRALPPRPRRRIPR